MKCCVIIYGEIRIKEKWKLCHVCRNNTRVQRYGKIQYWKTFPYTARSASRKVWLKQRILYITVIKEPDAKTQSRWSCELSHGSAVLSFIHRTSSPNKKTEFWWAVLSRPQNTPSKLCFEFGGILLCWSDTATPLLIKSGSYLHTTRQKWG